MTAVPGEPPIRDQGSSAYPGLPALPEQPAGSRFGRVAAAAASVLTLLACATFTLGTVLVAPLGVLVARALARRRGGILTRGPAWAGAVLASFLGVPIVFALLLTQAPPGTVAGVRAAMDSAQTHQKPAEMPEWLQRVAPPGTQQRSAATHKLFTTGPMVTFFSVLSAIVVCSMLGTIAGSIGWVASMLFAYAVKGRWVPGSDPRPLVPITDE
jgi:hypothetical protein